MTTPLIEAIASHIHATVFVADADAAAQAALNAIEAAGYAVVAAHELVGGNAVLAASGYSEVRAISAAQGDGT